MTSQELREKLLQVADMLAAMPIPEVGDVRTGASISVHDIADRQSLAAWARVIESPERKHSGSTCWLRGRFGPIDISVFYEPGLLGEVVVTDGTDAVERLLAEFAEPVAV